MKRKPGEPITENRKIISICGSYYLNLPREFVEGNGIKPGQKVAITAHNDVLKVITHSRN